jgi:hypothetical protein
MRGGGECNAEVLARNKERSLGCARDDSEKQRRKRKKKQEKKQEESKKARTWEKTPAKKRSQAKTGKSTSMKQMQRGNLMGRGGMNDR